MRAQESVQLSPGAEISLLTCEPGPALYAAFGHSAVRVYDPENGIDLVFNYGTFDFSTPNFYWKFIRGKLDYILSVSTYRQFLSNYEYYDRSVYQQFLNLEADRRQFLYDFLIENYEPENRAYKYDFFFDNCATRIRDLLEVCLQEEDLSWGRDSVTEGRSFHELVIEYTEDRPWADMGISLIFGIPAAAKADERGHQFLPDYMMYAFAGARYNGAEGRTALVERTEQVVFGSPMELSTPLWQRPSFFSWLVALLFGTITLLGWRQGRHNYWIDRAMLLFTGLLGLFFLFCWFGTDHAVLPWNINMLWAFPFHFAILFGIGRLHNKGWLRKYAAAFTFISLLMLLAWLVLPQILHKALWPLVLLTGLRWAWIWRSPMRL